MANTKTILELNPIDSLIGDDSIPIGQPNVLNQDTEEYGDTRKVSMNDLTSYFDEHLEHIENHNNPHNVTAAQTDTYSKSETEELLQTGITHATEQMQINIDNEVDRATTAEELIQIGITQAEERLQANINNEVARAIAAEELLQPGSTQTADRLQANIDSETARAIAAEERLGNVLLADQVDGYGRDLMETILGHGIAEMTTQEQRNEAIAEVMTELSRRCNNNGEIDDTGIPDFHGLAVGDYLDGLDLSAITEAPGGNTPQPWNDTYKNNRIMIAGFNTYKDVMGNDKNHILFTFRNIICEGCINTGYSYSGGYMGSALNGWLEEEWMPELNRIFGGDYLYSMELPHVDGGTEILIVFLPTEIEVFGYQELGDEISNFNTISIQFPIYQKAGTYRSKRFNGLQAEWLLQTKYERGMYTSFVGVAGGVPVVFSPSMVTGISPAFSIA